MDVLEVAGARIAGLAACVPTDSVPNDPKAAAATGIPARRVAPDGVSGLDLCLAAARRVLADTGARPADFGAILAVSFTQETRMPSLAALLVRETGKKVLLLDGDKQSAFLKADDLATAPLLSDGGTATVVEKAEAGGAPWRFAFQTDGEKGTALKLEKDGTIEMDGFGVFRFVATDVVAFLKEFISTLTPSILAPSLLSPYFFVPHQPNVYMVRQLAKAVGMEDRVLLSADRFGNLASASVPTTLAAHAARFASAEGPTRVLFAGFGGGLAISAGLVEIASDCHLSCEDLEPRDFVRGSGRDVSRLRPRGGADAPPARPNAPLARPNAPPARPGAPSARPGAPSARPNAPQARPDAPPARPDFSCRGAAC